MPVSTSAYRLSFEDWLASPDDALRREIIDGELFIHPLPNIAHQRLSRDVAFLLHSALRATKRGEVLHGRIGLRLGHDTVVEPDLVVVLHGSAATIAAQAVMGPADLVVEILSPGTARRDLTTKRQAYESFGVREYWIVDPEAQAIEVLALEGTGYVRHGIYRRHETLGSRVLDGFEMVLAEVFPPRP